MQILKYNDEITNEEKELHIEDKLAYFLNKKVKGSLSKKDKDYVMLIDGYEGAGKSTFGQQIGKWVDPSLNLSRICMTAEEFHKAINEAPKDSCVIYDEAVTGMSAGDSIAKVGKVLKALMMQMRQKNLFVIIIIPSVFELNRYTVLSRARSFFHVYENKGMRGFYVGYNQRDLKNLYLKGKQFYNYKVRSYFNGRFWGKYTVNEEAYREKKNKAMQNTEKKQTALEQKHTKQRNLAFKMLLDLGMTYNQIQEAFDKAGVGLAHSTLVESVVEARKMWPN